MAWSEFGNLGQSKAVEMETQRCLETVAPKSSSREEQISTAGRAQGPVKGEQNAPARASHGAGKGDADSELLSAPPLLPLLLPADAWLVGFSWADRECIFLLELQHVWENTPEGSGY